ncbi:hypothetical protein HDU81_006077 [Chytriomyces hyalinus]|nr:hypothetical protein HDU81_006077 [Chytriomyces hyalinus]
MADTQPAEKKRVGRRLDDSVPASRQQELNRQNGRKFRERQKQQLSSLEKQVAEFHDLTHSLRATLSIMQKENDSLKENIQSLQQANALLLIQQQQHLNATQSPCFNCAAEALKTQFYQEENIALKSKLMQQAREFELERLLFGQKQAAVAVNISNGFDFIFGMASPSPGPFVLLNDGNNRPALEFVDSNAEPQDSKMNGSFGNEEWLDVFGIENTPKTAEQVHGPLKVEFARYSLNLIPLLRGNHHVNVILDSLVAASRTSDRSKVRKLLARSIAAQHKLFTAPGAQDNRPVREAIFEILHTLKTFNTHHLDYMLDLIADKDGMARMFRETCRIDPGIARTQQALKTVPSLASAHHLIDEYAIIASQPTLTPELFMGLRQRMTKIENMCCPGSDDARLIQDIFLTHRRENKELIIRRLQESIKDMDLITQERQLQLSVSATSHDVHIMPGLCFTLGYHVGSWRGWEIANRGKETQPNRSSFGNKCDRMADTPPTEKKRVGRRPDESTPATRQQELNRQNGRKFRERQKQQLSSLEKQVAEFHDLTNSLRTTLVIVQKENTNLQDTIHNLQLSNSLLVRQLEHMQQNQLLTVGPSFCCNCAAEALKTQFYQEENNGLKAKLAVQAKEFELERSLFQTPPAMSMPGSFDFIFGMVSPPPGPFSALNNNNSQTQVPVTFTPENSLPLDLNPSGVVNEEWFDVFGIENSTNSVNSIKQTAEQAHGPMKVEFARYSLNLIPMLKKNNAVSMLLDSLIAASRTCDLPKLRKHLSRSIAAQHKLFNTPNLRSNKEEYEALSEVVSTLRTFNVRQIDHMLDLVADKDRMARMFRETVIIDPGIIKIQLALKDIPSLDGAHQLIDEFVIIASQPTIPPELFMELYQRLSKIERWCVPGTEDAKRVNDVFLSYRRHNKDAIRQQEMNRLNGRLYRERQKQQLSSLEKQVAEFHDLTHALRTTLSHLQKENEALKETIQNMQQSNSFPVIPQLQQLQQQQTHEPLRPSTCANCANEARKARFYQRETLDLNQKLESQAREVEWVRSLFTTSSDVSMGMVSPPEASSTIQNTNEQVLLSSEEKQLFPSGGTAAEMVLSDEWFDIFGVENDVKTSEQVNGPLKVEFARYSLNLIPLLKGSHFVNVILDSLVAASRTNDRVKVGKLLMRVMSAQNKILANPTLRANKSEHEAVHDIFHTLRTFNSQHYEYMLRLVTDEEKMARMLQTPCQAPPVVAKTLEELKAVPSLAGAHRLIDEMSIIASQPTLTPELIMELHQRVGKIERWCTPETEDAKRVFEIIATHLDENASSIARRLEKSMKQLDLN